MKSIVLLCISVFLTFLFVERENISLLVANNRQDISWYLGDNMEARLYDEAIWLTRQSRYQEAISLLTPLLNRRDLTHPTDVYELYGDLLYHTRGSTGDVLIFYNRAGEFSPTERLKQKIALLSVPKESPTATGSGNDDSHSTQSEQSDATGATLRASRIEEVRESNRTRRQSINLDAQAPEDIITRTLELLQTGSVIQDW